MITVERGRGIAGRLSSHRFNQLLKRITLTTQVFKKSSLLKNTLRGYVVNLADCGRHNIYDQYKMFTIHTWLHNLFILLCARIRLCFIVRCLVVLLNNDLRRKEA